MHGKVMHVVISQDGFRHSFYEKKRLIFFVNYNDEVIINNMKKLLVYQTFMENIKQKKAENTLPQISSVLQINHGLIADIFCYFSGFDHAHDNGFVQYHFPHRFKDKQQIMDAWTFIRSNHIIDQEEWHVIPKDLNDSRIN